MKEQLQEVQKALDQVSGWACHDDLCTGSGIKCDCGYSQALDAQNNARIVLSELLATLDNVELVIKVGDAISFAIDEGFNKREPLSPNKLAQAAIEAITNNN